MSGVSSSLYPLFSPLPHLPPVFLTLLFLSTERFRQQRDRESEFLYTGEVGELGNFGRLSVESQEAVGKAVSGPQWSLENVRIPVCIKRPDGSYTVTDEGGVRAKKIKVEKKERVPVTRTGCPPVGRRGVILIPIAGAGGDLTGGMVSVLDKLGCSEEIVIADKVRRTFDEKVSPHCGAVAHTSTPFVESQAVPRHAPTCR